MRNVALVFLCAITFAQAQGPRPTPAPSIVYAVHDPDAIKDYEANPRVLHTMVDRLVLAATGLSEVAKAWGTLVSPNDKIGSKVSGAGGEIFTTRHDVVTALVAGRAAAVQLR